MDEEYEKFLAHVRKLRLEYAKMKCIASPSTVSECKYLCNTMKYDLDKLAYFLEAEYDIQYQAQIERERILRKLINHEKK